MPKVDFTPAGLAALTTTLYALPDAELNLEADAVLDNYIGWADDHVNLSATQLGYLNLLPVIFIRLLAIQASIAFRKRRPVTVILPPIYPTPGDGAGKFFLNQSDLVVKVNGEGEFIATGGIIYEISYT